MATDSATGECGARSYSKRDHSRSNSCRGVGPLDDCPSLVLVEASVRPVLASSSARIASRVEPFGAPHFEDIGEIGVDVEGQRDAHVSRL